MFRNSGDFCTIEKTMALILNAEMEVNGFTDDKGVASVMTESIQDDLVLRKWAISNLKLEKDWKYKLKKKMALFLEKRPKLQASKKKISNVILPIYRNVKSIVSIHLDLVKDILLFLGMRHFCDLVLVSTCFQ